MAEEGKRNGVWKDVPFLPPTEVFDLNRRYKEDSDLRKINLGIGGYMDEKGESRTLKCVVEAEKSVIEKYEDKDYLPILGHKGFRASAQELLFGTNNPLISTVQSLSGTGALRLGAALIKRVWGADTEVYVPDPTWGNHFPIFLDEGVGEQFTKLKRYRYYDSKTRGLDFEGMKKDIESAPSGSIILLHGCAHNPTGVDPSKEEWNTLLTAIKSKKLVPFFDVAYQGFVTGDPDADAYAVRLFHETGVEFLAAQSFAKNMGLYGERVGAFHVRGTDEASLRATESVIEKIARAMYSNPPRHGALVAHEVLSTPKLKELWLKELKQMTGRILHMRQRLREELEEANTPGLWTHITEQCGMFSFTGLTEPQCQALINKHHLYLLTNGRINVAGLTENNVRAAAAAIKDVLTSQ